MRDDRPSQTAYRVALRRAAHQIFDHPPVLVDPVALRIIEPGAAANLRADGGRLAGHLRAFLVVRSRVAEDELARAVSRGVGQYVILGAGLDTFAYRNPFAERVLRVFEVDHPATQAWKRRRLAEGGILEPPSLRFVPVDFERDDLETALHAAGLQPDRPAFFAWLGVTPYLKLAAIRTTLRIVAAAARGGGGLVFDYGETPSRLGVLQRIVHATMAARVASVGEPWITFFNPVELRDELLRMGFTDVFDWGGAELNARYFAGRTDGLRVGGLGRIAVAHRLAATLVP
jgi:methyltransferase (TIGR00027 family)